MAKNSSHVFHWSSPALVPAHSVSAHGDRTWLSFDMIPAGADSNNLPEFALEIRMTFWERVALLLLGLKALVWVKLCPGRIELQLGSAWAGEGS